MLKPSLGLQPILALLLLPYIVSAAFDCKITLPGAGKNKHDLRFDLTALGGERTASMETETPPTKNEAKVRMNLCGDEGISFDDSLSEEDQCPTSTRLCLTLLNHKSSSSEAMRVTAVIPMWPVDEPQAGNVMFRPLENEEGLELLVAGASYAGSQQNISLKLLCSPMSTDENPTFESYTNSRLNLQWSTPEACGLDVDPEHPPPDDDEPRRRGGSGIWKFFKFLFWMGFIGLILYFAIGIYYNYTTYGASGKDLLPHRDFWLDLPTLLGDLVAHIMAGLKGRGGSRSGGGGGGTDRGGYTAL